MGGHGRNRLHQRRNEADFWSLRVPRLRCPPGPDSPVSPSPSPRSHDDEAGGRAGRPPAGNKLNPSTKEGILRSPLPQTGPRLTCPDGRGPPRGPRMGPTREYGEVQRQKRWAEEIRHSTVGSLRGAQVKETAFRNRGDRCTVDLCVRPCIWYSVLYCLRFELSRFAPPLYNAQRRSVFFTAFFMDENGTAKYNQRPTFTPMEVSVELGHGNQLQGLSKCYDDDGRLKRSGKVQTLFLFAPDSWTIWTASAHIVTAVIGSGVLSLAWAIAQLGWVAGPVVMLLFSFVTYYTSTLLADCYRSGDPVTGKRNYNYMDAVHAYLGGLKVKLCGCIQYANLFGVAVGYTIAASISMM
ncbi:hypothetical protein B296_00001303 [Ensete ventricosum]|uniref:Amino acid transporter transmembrane domain-containing protein n=1 Tax=Ensete ventricosum TaxID=4639 RepID=A0A427AJL9_ENSVE|nr:hypothetical protein B296_00001303 [Ensete ventricosum]